MFYPTRTGQPNNPITMENKEGRTKLESFGFNTSISARQGSEFSWRDIYQPIWVAGRWS